METLIPHLQSAGLKVHFRIVQHSSYVPPPGQEGAAEEDSISGGTLGDAPDGCDGVPDFFFDTSCDDYLTTGLEEASYYSWTLILATF